MSRIIGTYTGKAFDFFKPKPEDICLEDIAHHLACINRYVGATREPYSVAEHCVRCSYLTVGDPLTNLMHDSAEAYINDIASPQRRGLGWDLGSNISGMIAFTYTQIEAEILRQIGKALGIKPLEDWLTMPKETKVADLTMLATEVRDLINPRGWPIYAQWTKGIEPDTKKIVPWGWAFAGREFLRRFRELTWHKEQ